MDGLTTGDRPRARPLALSARVATYRALLRVVMTVSNPCHRRTAIGRSRLARGPASSRQRLTWVAPFQLV
ncbi:MAG: hypothetical protein ACRDP4_09860 [Nocardioidaceae bacterium]